MRNVFYTLKQLQMLDIIRCFRFIPMKVLFSICYARGIYRRQATISDVNKKFEKLGLTRSFYYSNGCKVIYITKKGADILIQDLGISADQINIPRTNQKICFARLEHTVEIANLYCELIQTVNENSEIEISNWISDQLIQCKYQYRSDKTARMVKRVLYPDSYFNIQKAESEFQIFLEYDTGSMDRKQLGLKFRQYFEYFVYGDWISDYTEFPIILFITNRSKERLQNISAESQIEIEKALSNRKIFIKSPNIIWKGIGLAENGGSIASYQIKNFLNRKFIFVQSEEKWAKTLLKELQ